MGLSNGLGEMKGIVHLVHGFILVCFRLTQFPIQVDSKKKKNRVTPSKGFTGDWFFTGQQDAGHTTRDRQVHISVYGAPTAVLARSTGFGPKTGVQ